MTGTETGLLSDGLVKGTTIRTTEETMTPSARASGVVVDMSELKDQQLGTHVPANKISNGEREHRTTPPQNEVQKDAKRQDPLGMVTAWIESWEGAFAMTNSRSESVAETSEEDEEDKTPDPPKKRTKVAKSEWEERYKELQAHKRKTGNANPARLRRDKGSEVYCLANWLAKQRHHFRQGDLTSDRIEALRSLGCNGFDADGKSIKSWEAWVEQLRAYKNRKGHANPLVGNETGDDDQTLAEWLDKMRHLNAIGIFHASKARTLISLGCNGFSRGDCTWNNES